MAVLSSAYNCEFAGYVGGMERDSANITINMRVVAKNLTEAIAYATSRLKQTVVAGYCGSFELLSSERM